MSITGGTRFLVSGVDLFSNASFIKAGIYLSYRRLSLNTGLLSEDLRWDEYIYWFL